MASNFDARDSTRAGGALNCYNVIFPGGVRVGAALADGGVINHPTVVAKTTGGSLTAANLVSGIIVADSLGGGALTLSIPNVEDILAAFALVGKTFAVGDQFEVIFVRGPTGANDLTVVALAAAPGKHAVTWATGVAPPVLVAAAGALNHVMKVFFEVTSVTTPAISMHYILG